MKKRLLILILLGIIIFVIQNACIENNQINKKINDFIKNATLIQEENNRLIYNVSRETSTAIKDGYIGLPGDILITKDSPIYLLGLRQIVDFTFGGHACIVTGEKIDGIYNNVGTHVIDSVGNQDINGVRLVKNDWHETRKSIIGLRVKNLSENDKIDILDKAHSLIGKKYNYSFIFNKKNTYYCTDLISRVYNFKNIKLNDGFITSTNDIIVSSDVYICYYQYIDKYGIEHIYY